MDGSWDQDMTSSVQSWSLKWGLEHSLDNNNKLGVLTEQFLKNWSSIKFGRRFNYFLFKKYLVSLHIWIYYPCSITKQIPGIDNFQNSSLSLIWSKIFNQSPPKNTIYYANNFIATDRQIHPTKSSRVHRLPHNSISYLISALGPYSSQITTTTLSLPDQSTTTTIDNRFPIIATTSLLLLGQTLTHSSSFHSNSPVASCQSSRPRQSSRIRMIWTPSGKSHLSAPQIHATTSRATLARAPTWPQLVSPIPGPWTVAPPAVRCGTPR